MLDKNTALTPQEVADILKIAKNTVYELIKRGELNAYRVGKKVRVDMADVEAYKNKTRNNARSNSNSSHPFKQSPICDDHGSEEGFVICGQDVILDILARHLETHSNGTRALRSYAGSYNGLYALYQDKAQLATCHLWDGDTKEYNTPFVRRMLPGIPAVIINLAYRMQGFYVARNNPKTIVDWRDLKRNDIKIVNREKGSGTRVLLDEHLRLMGISGYQVTGYDLERTSHLAVASAVSRGTADLGIGNEKTSLQVKNIDFLPLQEERYDLVIKKRDLYNPIIQALLEILISSEFKSDLEGIGGYNLKDTGKMISET